MPTSCLVFTFFRTPYVYIICVKQKTLKTHRTSDKTPPMINGLALRAPVTTTPTHSYGRFSNPTGNFKSAPITTSLLDGPVPF